MWIYLRSEPNLYTVGFYDPQGNWNSDSDWETRELARQRVHWLNGGELPENTYILHGNELENTIKRKV